MKKSIVMEDIRSQLFDKYNDFGRVTKNHLVNSLMVILNMHPRLKLVILMIR